MSEQLSSTQGPALTGLTGGPSTGRRRKNTRSDLGLGSTYRHSSSSIMVTNQIIPQPIDTSALRDDATAAPTVTDESIENMKSGKRRSHHKIPSSRTISALMLWVKNINRMRTIQATKAFYVWKYSVTNIIDNATEAPKEERSEQKNAYLALFAENERLREQITELKRTSNASEKVVRVSAMRLSLSTILRKKLMMRVRYYFDSWLSNTGMSRLIEGLGHRALDLEVGLQQVESERDYVHKTQVENANLRMYLSLTIFFFKWKSKAAAAALDEERRKFESQRVIIFKELRKMRERVVEANRIEKGEWYAARLRGSEAMDHLQVLRERLVQLSTVSNNSGGGGNTSRHRARTTSGDSDSASGTRPKGANRRSIS